LKKMRNIGPLFHPAADESGGQAPTRENQTPLPDRLPLNIHGSLHIRDEAELNAAKAAREAAAGAPATPEA
jgi:hypothetical protein